MVIDYCCFVNLSIIEEEIEEEIPKDIKNDRLIWKQIDLFNPSSAENFLQGSEVLIYLIHSLGAKIFEELDIRLSNSAGNAAKHVGIKKIIYLGGIVPDSRNVSPHLISRMKTGQALASHGIPVAEVRASILLATCSVSYLIVYFLAKRLPVHLITSVSFGLAYAVLVSIIKLPLVNGWLIALYVLMLWLSMLFIALPIAGQGFLGRRLGPLTWLEQMVLHVVFGIGLWGILYLLHSNK